MHVSGFCVLANSSFLKEGNESRSVSLRQKVIEANTIRNGPHYPVELCFAARSFKSDLVNIQGVV